MNSFRKAPLRAAAFLAAALSAGSVWACRTRPLGSAVRAPRRPATEGWLVLTMPEGAGVERRAEFVRAGVPFPRGALASADNLRVVASDGRELPSQRRVLASWPDGSARWLELCFEPTVAAGAVGHYRVEFGPQVRPARVPAPLEAKASGGTITVNTGRLRLQASARGLAAWLDADGDGRYGREEQVLSGRGLECFVELEALAKGAPAGRFLASADSGPPEGRSAWRLEESGPLRAVLALRGWHADPSGRRVCPYLLRVSACRGSGSLRLVHTLTLSEDPAAARVAEAGLWLDLAAGGRPPAALTLEQDVAAPKRYPDLAGFVPRFRLLAGQTLLAGGTTRGWVEAQTRRCRLAAAVPRPAEDAPWELRVEPDPPRVTAAFWPRWGLGFTDARSPDERGEPGFQEFELTESFERFWPAGAGGGGRTAVGASRTHELWLSFAPPGEAQGQAEAFAAQIAAPLVAWPGMDWLSRAGAFGRLAGPAGAGGDGEASERLSLGAARLADWLRWHQRRRFGWLGIWDYGDCQTIYRRRGDLDVGARWWNWHGQWGWLQGRARVPEAFMALWLSGGAPADWEDFRAAAEHNLDVDTVAGSCGPKNLWGLTHGGGATHWSGRPCPAATRPELWLDYYYLSGERRALEAVERLAANLSGRKAEEFADAGAALSADQAGWACAALAAREGLGDRHAAWAQSALEFLSGLSARELGGGEFWPQRLAPVLARYARAHDDPAAARLLERGTRAYLGPRGPASRGAEMERNCWLACAACWGLTGDGYFLRRAAELARRSACWRAAGAGPLAADGSPPAEMANDARALGELAALPALLGALAEAGIR